MASSNDYATSNINLVVANVDSLYSYRMKTKTNFLREFSVMENCSFVCVSESHLRAAISDAEIKMDGFTLYRADRAQSRQRGGVATYVRDCPAWNAEVLMQHSNAFVETLGLYIKALNLVLINIYRPPECEYGKFKNSLDKLSATLASLQAPLPEIMIVGDLNFPNMDWATLSPVAGAPTLEKRQAALLKDFMEDWCLVQCVQSPTRGNNVLDVVLCNNDRLVRDVRTDTTEYSDHRWLVVTTDLCGKNGFELREEKECALWTN